MRFSKIWTFLFFIAVFCNPLFAGSNNEIYKQLGNYNYVVAPGLRVYYPESINKAIPRILTDFAIVRERITKNFEKEKNYVATVILNDHDNVIDSTAGPNLDLIKIGVFDEMDMFSARSYPLEKRFAYSLSKTLIKRMTSNASFAWRRSLAMLATPKWFIEGMALNYAFPIDSVHYSRILDMARFGRLYSLNELNAFDCKATLIKEEMMFQAHSMLEYWAKTYNKKADIAIMESVVRRPVGFANAFKKYYGVSLKEAFDSYVKYVSEQSIDFESFKDPDFLDVDYARASDKIFRSYTKISENERIWVSSKRYNTEHYDLYYRKGISKPVILLKNVHPTLLYDRDEKKIVIGRYQVNSKRQKSLSLWSVELNGKARCLVREKGSFKPLGISGKEIYYSNLKSGITQIRAVNKETGSERLAFDFGSNIRPLDLAFDVDNQKIFYSLQTADFCSCLVVVPITAKDIGSDSKILLRYNGDLRSLKFFNGKLWLACDRDHFTTQLFSFDEEKSCLKKYSSLSGGVWDINFSGTEKQSVEVSTLSKGGFAVASLRLDEEPLERIKTESEVLKNKESLFEFKVNKYKTEFNTSLWQPVLGKDADGKVLGVYSYRTDRLDRNGIVVAPTCGLKSNDWGYTSTFMKRFDLLKASLSFDDYTELKGYMTTDYYERIKSKKLSLEYPLALDINLAFGFDLTDRGIAKIKSSPDGRVPTAGKDHFYFAKLCQKSIRTEPYKDIFPRKGREVEVVYKKGTDVLFGGDMLYDRLSVKWNEYMPLGDYFVLTLGGCVADDDKHNNFRRPDDLSLGNDFYMRAFDSSYKSGNKLRYIMATLARPIHVVIPRQISWIRNEFSALGVFWEMGDIKNDHNFDYDYDRGVEFTSKLLFMKRLPIGFKAGYAVRNGEEGHSSYYKLFVEDFL